MISFRGAFLVSIARSNPSAFQADTFSRFHLFASVVAPAVFAAGFWTRDPQNRRRMATAGATGMRRFRASGLARSDLQATFSRNQSYRLSADFCAEAQCIEPEAAREFVLQTKGLLSCLWRAGHFQQVSPLCFCGSA